ncbi:MAG TPA: TVP38/TMEM64 family protein [Geobacteraceae bacterium]|nr:TVP38/TMEM64 family protein [Geobacteraceae bacterium]
MNGKKLLIIILFILLAALYFHFHLGRFISLAALKAHREELSAFYGSHRLATVSIFVAIYVVQTALSLPGAAVLSLAAGALFGAFMGTVYANLAATIGATLAFLATRYLLHDAVERKFGDRLEKLNRELEERGINYLLFLRLVPIFPFFLINLAAGLTRLPLRTFVIGTMVGIIPGGFVYCNAGASLATINDSGGIASFRVLASFALLGLFALLPVFYGRFRNKADGGNH